jgi:hypothetical protein
MMVLKLIVFGTTMCYEKVRHVLRLVVAKRRSRISYTKEGILVFVLNDGNLRCLKIGLIISLTFLDVLLEPARNFGWGLSLLNFLENNFLMVSEIFVLFQLHIFY